MYPGSEDRANSRLRGWLAAAVVGALGLALLISGLVLTLGQRRVAVRGRSMAPLLEERELVLVNRLAYLFWRPKRGDVVLVQGRVADGPTLLLKRVVGVPGEAVTLARDRLSIDGRPLDLGRPVVGSSPGSWLLGQSQYFLLSENLAIGTDSRHTGPVERSSLLGRAWLVYTPGVRRLARTPLRFAEAADAATSGTPQTRNVTQAIDVNA